MLGIGLYNWAYFWDKKTPLFIFALQKARKGSSLFFETISFYIYSLIIFKIICFIFVKHLEMLFQFKKNLQMKIVDFPISFELMTYRSI